MLEANTIAATITKALFTRKVPSEVMVEKGPLMMFVALFTSLPTAWRDSLLFK